MTELLKNAITIVEIIIGVIALLLLGDYLGHKIGRLHLAMIGGIIVLITIAGFAIYAAVILWTV